MGCMRNAMPEISFICWSFKSMLLPERDGRGKKRVADTGSTGQVHAFSAPTKAGEAAVAKIPFKFFFPRLSVKNNKINKKMNVKIPVNTQSTDNTINIIEPTTYTYYHSVVCQDIIYTSNFKNIMELPRIMQCVLNSSSASALKEKSRGLAAHIALETLSCQKNKSTRARQSLAFFQLRKGNLLGCTVNLRGEALYSFLDQYIFLVSPLLRKNASTGKRKKSESQGGPNYTFGQPGVTSFPGLESHFLLLSNVGGFDCTFLSSCSRASLVWVLAALQFPAQPS